MVELKSQFAPHPIDKAFSVLDGIRPISSLPAKQQLKATVTGRSGNVLAFVLSSFLALLTIGALVTALFPHSILNPILELFSLALAPVYGIYILLAEIVKWNKQKSIVHPDHIEKRKHDTVNIQSLLAQVQDKALLEKMLIEIKHELEELKSTSSTFIDAIKDLSPLLLAVITIIAIHSNQKNESVSLHSTALLIGSLAIIVAYLMKFPTFRRIELYNYWSYIVEQAIKSFDICTIMNTDFIQSDPAVMMGKPVIAGSD